MIRMLGVTAVAVVLAGCGTTVEIEVVDVASGQPVPNAEIVLGVTMVTLFPGDTHGVTDEHGIARMSINREDAMLFDVRAVGYRRHPKPPVQWVRFKRGLAPGVEPRGSNLWVEYMERGEPARSFNEPGVAVEIQVIDRSTGRPVPGFNVDLANEGCTFGRTEPTDSEGVTTVCVQPHDGSWVSIWVPGWRQVDRPFLDWWKFKRELVPDGATKPRWIEYVEPGDPW